MVAATGKPEYQAPYVPLPEGFVNVPYNDLEAIQAATTAKTCAVFLEPIQGEGGVIIPHDVYLRHVRDWCDRKGLLLILDEVQTGCGRTGTLFNYQQSGIEPDIMTAGKGLGGGIPIAAIMVKERAAVFAHGDHGSTYGGNPLVCATALANMRYIIGEDIPGRAERVGRYLRQALSRMQERFPVIKEVRGRGLLIAVEFHEPITDQLVNFAIEHGLLLNPNRPHVIRMMPPLTIETADIDEALEVFVAGLESARLSAGVR